MAGRRSALLESVSRHQDLWFICFYMEKIKLEFPNENGRKDASHHKERGGTCVKYKNGFELKTGKMGHNEGQGQIPL